LKFLKSRCERSAFMRSSSSTSSDLFKNFANRLTTSGRSLFRSSYQMKIWDSIQLRNCKKTCKIFHIFNSFLEYTFCIRRQDYFVCLRVLLDYNDYYKLTILTILAFILTKNVISTKFGLFLLFQASSI